MERFFEEIAADGVFLDVRGELARRARRGDHLAHQVGRYLAKGWVLALLTLVPVVWVVVNSVAMLWRPLDPYPYALLGTIYSSLSPVIALMVLMRQNRDQQVAELNAEMNLQALLHTERKVTVVLHLLEAQRRGVPPDLDEELLHGLLRELDHARLVEALRRRLEDDERLG